MMEIMALVGFNLAYIVAGFSGGVVTLIFVQTDRRRAIAGTMGGALVANYLAQPLLKWLSLPATAELGGAFICGIVAIKIVKGIYLRGERFAEGKSINNDPDNQPKET